LFFRAWQVEFAGGVGVQQVLFAEPSEKVFDRSEAAALGGDAERFVVLFL